jgi:hypothetical protein
MATPAKTWTPSNPGGISRDTPLSTNPDQYGGTLPWDATPAGSHVSRTKFYDARKYSFLRRFGPERTRGMSQIHVRFRDPKGRETSEYWYFVADHAAAAEFYARMRAAEHPGALVPDLEALAKSSGGGYQKQGQFS